MTWVRVGVSPVIHFSTAPFIHSCTAADQPVRRKHPQAYAQAATLATPGAGVIGACSHAGPGSFVAVNLAAVAAVTVAAQPASHPGAQIWKACGGP